MPPLSPAPGWTRGDVCMESMASRRMVGGTLPRSVAVAVLATERVVDADQRLLLVLVQVRVAEDLTDQVGGAGALLEDAGPDVQRLRRDLQGAGDLLEDLGGRLAQAPLDLAEVGVRDPGQLRQLPEAEVPDPPLLADELAEVVPPRVELVLDRVV